MASEMAEKSTNNVPTSIYFKGTDTSLNLTRTTFVEDLKAIENILWLFIDIIDDDPARSPPRIYDQDGYIPCRFDVVLHGYDVHEREDFEQMKEGVFEKGQDVQERIAMVLKRDNQDHPLIRDIEALVALIGTIEDKSKEDKMSVAESSLSDEIHLRGGGVDDAEADVDPRLGLQRTTFPQDLLSLDALLCSTLEALSANAEDLKKSGHVDLYSTLEYHFDIVLREYDPRKPGDFKEMKDTAGLTAEHFEDLAREFRTKRGINEDGDQGEEGYDLVNASMVSVTRLIRIIEAMRDRGHAPPSYWLGDEILPRDEAEDNGKKTLSEVRLRGGGNSDDSAIHVDEHLDHRRTTFPQDLKFLNHLLVALSHNTSTITSWERSEDGRAIIPEPLNTMFDTVEGYDPRKPADFEEMKDTAGLTGEHFQGLAKEIRKGRGMSESGEDGAVEYNDYLNMKLGALSELIEIIENMRDDGMEAPIFWLGDAVCLRNDAGEAVGDNDDVDDEDDEEIKKMTKTMNQPERGDDDKAEGAADKATRKSDNNKEDGPEVHLRGGGHDDVELFDKKQDIHLSTSPDNLAEDDDVARSKEFKGTDAPVNLGKSRTTFARDLKYLDMLLFSLEIQTPGLSVCQRYAKHDFYARMFDIVLHAYDPEKEQDLQEMLGPHLTWNSQTHFERCRDDFLAEDGVDATHPLKLNLDALAHFIGLLEAEHQGPPNWAKIILRQSAGNPDLGVRRTTFPQDLKLLHSFLKAFKKSVSLGDWPRDQDDKPLIPEPLDTMFRIVTNCYDPRKTEDFEEMKDTAGLSKEDLKDLCIDLICQRGRDVDHSTNDALSCKCFHASRVLSVIEKMRDHGGEAPDVWPEPCICKVDCRGYGNVKK